MVYTKTTEAGDKNRGKRSMYSQIIPQQKIEEQKAVGYGK